MLFGQDRGALRRQFFEVWRKHTAGVPLEPLEQLVAQVIARHPEYHGVLQDPERFLDRDYLPEMGETNPFLHMAMHIAIHEQLTTGRPPGILDAYQGLLQRLGEPHRAEHEMMECLGEMFWRAQREQRTPDEAAYLECLRGRGAAR